MNTQGELPREEAPEVASVPESLPTPTSALVRWLGPVLAESSRKFRWYGPVRVAENDTNIRVS